MSALQDLLARTSAPFWASPYSSDADSHQLCISRVSPADQLNALNLVFWRGLRPVQVRVWSLETRGGAGYSLPARGTCNCKYHTVALDVRPLRVPSTKSDLVEPALLRNASLHGSPTELPHLAGTAQDTLFENRGATPPARFLLERHLEFESTHEQMVHSHSHVHSHAVCSCPSCPGSSCSHSLCAAAP